MVLPDLQKLWVDLGLVKSEVTVDTAKQICRSERWKLCWRLGGNWRHGDGGDHQRRECRRPRGCSSALRTPTFRHRLRRSQPKKWKWRKEGNQESLCYGGQGNSCMQIRVWVAENIMEYQALVRWALKNKKSVLWILQMEIVIDLVRARGVCELKKSVKTSLSRSLEKGRGGHSWRCVWSQVGRYIYIYIWSLKTDGDKLIENGWSYKNRRDASVGLISEAEPLGNISCVIRDLLSSFDLAQLWEPVTLSMWSLCVW